MKAGSDKFGKFGLVLVFTSHTPSGGGNEGQSGQLGMFFHYTPYNYTPIFCGGILNTILTILTNNKRIIIYYKIRGLMGVPPPSLIPDNRPDTLPDNPDKSGFHRRSGVATTPGWVLPSRLIFGLYFSDISLDRNFACFDKNSLV